MKLALKGLGAVVLQVISFACLLLIPARTWYWPRAILYLVTYCTIVSAIVVALARSAPHGLEARFQSRADSQPVADRIATRVARFAGLAWFVLIPVDVFHLRLTPAPPLIVSSLGGAVFLVGLGIMLTTHFQNPFLAPIVSIQRDRGHELVDTGLYSYIRHPMYVGSLMFVFGLALWLESTTAALATLALVPFFVTRIIVEERTLILKLPGYADYIKNVRYRLIPFVW